MARGDSRPHRAPRCKLVQRASESRDGPSCDCRARQATAGALAEAEREVAERPEDGEHPREDRVPEHGAEGAAVDRRRAVVAEQEVLLARDGHGLGNGSVAMSSNFTLVDEDRAGAAHDHVAGARDDAQDERPVVGVAIGDDLALVRDGCVHERRRRQGSGREQR